MNGGWIRWIKSSFEPGTISDIWKNEIELEKWFDSAFQDFINKEIISTLKEKKLLNYIFFIIVNLIKIH